MQFIVFDNPEKEKQISKIISVVKKISNEKLTLIGMVRDFVEKNRNNKKIYKFPVLTRDILFGILRRIENSYLKFKSITITTNSTQPEATSIYDEKNVCLLNFFVNSLFFLIY